MQARSAEFREHLNFTDLLENRWIVAAGIGPERDAWLLVVDPDDKNVPLGRIEQPGWVSFPHSVSELSYPATALRLNYTLLDRIDIAEVVAAFSFIQPLPHDEILLVGSRSEYREGSPEQNASVYRQDGTLVRRMCFGDGIESVQVAHDGHVWVSYFDEGVIGNLGWPDPPFGNNGLLCLDGEGHIVWRFLAPGGFDIIVDCYALNVANDAVWLYYYSEFPIVKVTLDHAVVGWENSFRGARAVTVSRSHALLWGGYDEEKTWCVVQRIEGDRLVDPVLLDLRLPDGTAIEDARVFGRDSILHAFVGTVWYQFDLREFSG